MTLADGFWSGAGGAIVAALIGLVGVLVGYLVEALRNRRKERMERERVAREVRDSSRAIAGAFENIASALRVAGAGNGSLQGLDVDDPPHDDFDRIRRDAGHALWSEIEDRRFAIKTLRDEQRLQHTIDPGDAEDCAGALEKTAGALRAAYP